MKEGQSISLVVNNFMGRVGAASTAPKGGTWVTPTGFGFFLPFTHSLPLRGFTMGYTRATPTGLKDGQLEFNRLIYCHFCNHLYGVREQQRGPIPLRVDT